DQTWDVTLSEKLTDEVWINDNDSDRLITRTEYDSLGLGLPTKRWKPEQNYPGGAYTELTYDNRSLFVATETNELGHQRAYTWDYGSGIRLRTEGPNQQGSVKEQTKI